MPTSLPPGQLAGSSDDEDSAAAADENEIIHEEDIQAYVALSGLYPAKYVSGTKSGDFALSNSLAGIFPKKIVGPRVQVGASP